jgi:membrane protein DedA with SNARE-associated domain
MEALFRDLLAWVAAHPYWAYVAVFGVALAESVAVVGLVVPGVMMLLGAGALISTGGCTSCRFAYGRSPVPSPATA